MREYRLLVTGSRIWTDEHRLTWELSRARINTQQLGLDLRLVLGDCPTGADAMALKWATERNIDHDIYTADWVLCGKAAGPRRNQRMVDHGKPDMVIAFLSLDAPNRGTNHCADYAAGKLISVRRVYG